MTDPNGTKIPPQVLWLLIGVIGGIAKDLHEWVISQGKLGIAKLAAGAFISGFVALIAGEIVIRFRPEWAFVAAGIAGFAGVRVLTPLVDILLRRLSRWTGEPPQQS